MDTYGSVITVLRGESVTQIEGLVANMGYAEGYGYSIINYFMRSYLVIVIYGIIALVAFPVLINKIAREHKLRLVIAFYGPLAAITLFAIISYFLNLPFEADRLLFYIIIIMFFMVGFLLFEFIKWCGTKTRALSLISIVLVGIFVFGASVSGIAKLYPSPYTYYPNLQNTRTEISGMDWFLKKKDVTIYSAGWYLSPYRYADFLLAPQESQGRNDLSAYVTKNLPWHLGYDHYTNLGNYFNADIYVVLRDFNRVTYTQIYPQMASIRLLPSDLNKLEQDPTVNRLYDNEGLEVYYVSVTPPKTVPP